MLRKKFKKIFLLFAKDGGGNEVGIRSYSLNCVYILGFYFLGGRKSGDFAEFYFTLTLDK